MEMRNENSPRRRKENFVGEKYQTWAIQQTTAESDVLSHVVMTKPSWSQHLASWQAAVSQCHLCINPPSNDSQARQTSLQRPN
jgi:hypothetical protein